MSEEQKSQRPSNEVLQRQYNDYKSKLTQMSQKIGELESEIEEHKAVLETLNGTDADRKCYRMVGGALMEKTVKEVKPDVNTNLDGLKSVIAKLTEEYQKTDKEMKTWREKYNVKVVHT